MSKETIKCTDENIKRIVHEEIKLYGYTRDLNYLDVSNVTDMSGLFEDLPFNGNISKWNVSRVKNMNSMFRNSGFNNDISNWDVSNVTDMSDIFYGAEAFSYSNTTCDIGKWDLSSVDFNSLDITQSFENQKNSDSNKWIVKAIPIEKARRNAKEKRSNYRTKVFFLVFFVAILIKLIIYNSENAVIGWMVIGLISLILKKYWHHTFRYEAILDEDGNVVGHREISQQAYYRNQERFKFENRRK
jgi:surface protein